MENNNKPIENVVDGTLKNLKSIIDVNSVVGKAFVENGTTIIPISKVSVGFVSGGGEYDSNKKKKKIENFPFAGGSGGGCNITPLGFLVVTQKDVKFIKVNFENNVEKIIDVISNFTKTVK